MSVYEKLKALNVSLPEMTQPVAAFVPYVRSGNLLFVSGHIAKIDGKPWVGAFVVPKGVLHRPRAPERTVILMVEGAGIIPTGDK